MNLFNAVKKSSTLCTQPISVTNDAPLFYSTSIIMNDGTNYTVLKVLKTSFRVSDGVNKAKTIRKSNFIGSILLDREQPNYYKEIVA